jgi:predicted regulator of Ras-like GTPase activity (Roadblock/LC7/MglB family)
MAESAARSPQRDSAESPFSDILAALAGCCPGFRAAVFFDGDGETVDYHSFLEPFETRLVGAHHGVVMSSARSRFAWLGLGELERLEYNAGWRDSITVSLGGDYYLTVLVETGTVTEELSATIDAVAVRLKQEAGL